MTVPSGVTICVPEVGEGEGEAATLPTVTVTLAAAALPEESVARAEIVCEALVAVVLSHDALHDPVPDASCHAPPSTETSTRVTLALSEAVPDTLTVPPTVAPDEGDE